MLTTSLLMLVGGQYFAPDRLDLSQRLIELDRHWMKQRDIKKREVAVASISRSVTGFFSGNNRQVAIELDQALLALGTKPSQIQNQRFRAKALLIDAEEKPEVNNVFLYPLPAPTKVETAREKENRLNRMADEMTRETNRQIKLVTQVPSLYVLLDKARKSENLDVRAWMRRLKTYTKGETPEFEENLNEEWKAFIRAGEPRSKLNDSRSKPATLWYGEQGPTRFHLRWPRGFDSKNATVVIALHGAGGSPAMFLKSYGAGICASEATKRGWIFMSPDSTGRAVRDCLLWLEAHEIKVGRLILLGHRMGGGVAATYAGKSLAANVTSGANEGLDRKPDAVALFAPATQLLSPTMDQIPTYVAVGKQEMMMLVGGIQKIRNQGKDWAKFMYEESDPCEHLMIVADKAKAAYEFIDRQLGKK
jgi:hypothetical protein